MLICDSLTWFLICSLWFEMFLLEIFHLQIKTWKTAERVAVVENCPKYKRSVCLESEQWGDMNGLLSWQRRWSFPHALWKSAALCVFFSEKTSCRLSLLLLNVCARLLNHIITKRAWDEVKTQKQAWTLYNCHFWDVFLEETEGNWWFVFEKTLPKTQSRNRGGRNRGSREVCQRLRCIESLIKLYSQSQRPVYCQLNDFPVLTRLHSALPYIYMPEPSFMAHLSE